MSHLPENSDIAGLNSKNPAKENEADPEMMEQLRKMGVKVHLVLRMAAMGMLERKQNGFVMNVDEAEIHIPGAKTLFGAYLNLERNHVGNWNELDRSLQAPWTQEAIRMVLDPWKYTEVWRTLRMTLVSEALLLLKQYAGQTEEKEASKLFTLIGLSVCDQVINTLARSEEAEN